MKYFDGGIFKASRRFDPILIKGKLEKIGIYT